MRPNQVVVTVFPGSRRSIGADILGESRRLANCRPLNNQLVKWMTNSGLLKGLMVAVPAGHKWRYYYYAAGVRVAEREVTSTTNTVYYLLGDHLGSTSIIASEAGGMTGELRYKAWGENRLTSGTLPTKRHYTGQIQDSALGGTDGLYFYNARWLDPYLSWQAKNTNMRICEIDR